MAAALPHRPDLLVLDEPAAGLDPVARKDVLDLLQAFAADPSHAVLISSHITSDLERIADRIAFIRQGRIVLSGATCDLMRDGSLESLMLRRQSRRGGITA